VAALFNQLQKLKEEKGRFEDRQGFLFRDRDLDCGIQVVNQEIEGSGRIWHNWRTNVMVDPLDVA
jgi:hypothetical protein